MTSPATSESSELPHHAPDPIPLSRSMPGDRLPDRSEVTQAGRHQARRRRWRAAAAALIIVVALLCIATGPLFIWPPGQGMPARVDAIVVLGGQGNRLGKGLELARQGRAPVLVISRGLPHPVPGSVCGLRSRTLTVICFSPRPRTTQGEAEFVSRLANRYHWRSVVLVVTPDQVIRARIRFERCYAGQVYAVTTPLPVLEWPYQIAYQWAAMFKEEVLQRSC
jgi:uncharacterized SAM-binding protein YcdF (DUF218 family)